MSKTVSVVEAAGFKVTGGTTMGVSLKGTVAVTIAAGLAAAEEDITVTITGAAAGDIVMVTPLSTAMETGVGIAGAWVSAADTVKIRVTNLSASTLTGSTTNFSYLIIKS